MSPSSVAISTSSNSGFVKEQLPNQSIAMAVGKAKGVSRRSAHELSLRGNDSAVSPDCPFSDTVNRIVLAAEARQVHASNPCGNIFGDSEEDCTTDEAEMNGRRVKLRKCKGLNENDGPLTDQELSHLGVLCSSANRNFEDTNRNEEKRVVFSWDSVGVDQLESLITMLDIHVNNASNIDIVSLAINILTGQSEEEDDEAESSGRKKFSIEQWLSAKSNVEASTKGSSSMVGSGYRLITTLRRGLESASIILSIMISCNSSNGNSRRVLNEEILEACLALLKQHLIKNIVPSLSETVPLHIVPANTANPLSAKKRKRKKADYDNPEPNEGDHLTQCRDHTPSKDKIKSTMRKVYKAILSTYGLLTLLMERGEALIQSAVQLDDRPILTITSSVLAIFTVDPPIASSSDNVASIARGLQVAAIRLITSVVRGYPRHRVIVLEDLFPLMLKLPSSKRSLRTYPLRLTKYVSSRYRRNHSADCNSTVSSTPPHWTYGGFIQVTTALILSIVQSFVAMPHLEIADVEPNPKSSRTAKKAKILRSVTKYTSGLLDCNSACSFLATQLANRCAKKGQDGGASEFRPFLANLIDDLLVVQLFPEYPAAESLLMAFCRKLSSDLLFCKQEKAPSLEVTYMAIAMESLGKICAATAGHLRYSRENPLALPRDNSNTEEIQAASVISAPINNKEEINRCFCDRINLIDTYMIDCDRCHGWFHASCVGIARDELPSYWVCDDCKIQIMVIEQIEAISSAISRSGAQASITDEIPIFRQLLLNHLTGTSLAGVIPDPVVAREFLLAKWIDQLQSEKDHGARGDAQNFDDSMCSYYLNQWISAMPCRIHSDDTLRVAVTEKQQLSDEGNARVVRTLIAKSSELVSSFPNQLGVIVKLMGDESANALRKLAVKAIAQVVQVDTSLMLQTSLRQAVARRFSDEAISVREAAVSLVGCYVLQDPKVASAFHSSLIARLNDVGISVKRRVVRIFRDLLISQPTYSGRVEICSSMLQRAANPREEEGVRDDIKNMFKELWFDEETMTKSITSISRAVSISETTKVPSANDVATEARAKAQRFREIVTQMVDVVATLSDTVFLETMVKNLFSVSEDGGEKAVANPTESKTAATEDYCSNLVSALFEELLQFEENRCRNTQCDGDSRLVSIMVTIRIFCEAVPGRLAAHLDTLLPYLKADNLSSIDDEAKILTTICRLIVKLVSSGLPLTDVQRLSSGSVIDDLGKITLKFGSVASAAAVEALATIASRMGANGDQRAENNLMKLATTFYGYLYKIKDMTNDYSTTNVGVQSNLKRALSVLQAICQHHTCNQNFLTVHSDLEADDDPTSFPYLQPSSLLPSNLLSACFAAFSFYLEKSDAPTKCAALNAMSGVFLARPRVMLAVEKRGVFAVLFSEIPPPMVQLEALHCWKNILSAEEWRVESGKAREKMDLNANVSLSKRISGDQDGDSSIAGSVLTQHTKRIYQLAKSNHAAIRLAAVDLIGLLLRQGLINPLESVPHLLALQGDIQNPTIRLLALRLLVREGEKRPDMLRQRLYAGVKEAYIFQQKIIRSDEQASAVIFETQENSCAQKVECIFGLLYKECLSSSKVAKQALFKTLIKSLVSFDADEESNAAVPDVGGVENRSAKKTKRNETINRDSMTSPVTALNLPFLCYVSQILAHLPYNASMDPLYIVYHISNAITMHGEPLLYRFARFLGPHLASISTVEDSECEDVNYDKDIIEEAAMSVAPSLSKAARLFENPDFDVDFFAHLCRKAFSIILLIRLQQFLKTVYNLSDARCLEYNPNEKDKVSDRSINILEKVPLFKNKFEPCVQDTFAKTSQISMAAKIDAVIYVYAEFRHLMRTVGLASVDKQTSKE